MAAFLPGSFKVVERSQAIEGADMNSVFTLLIPVDYLLFAGQDLFPHFQIRAIVLEPWASGAMLKEPKGGLTSKLQHADIFGDSSCHTILLQAKLGNDL
jgi:hypothetical protein